MPNDARLGLVVGVTLVILIAVLFFGRDGKRAGAAGNLKSGPAAAATTAGAGGAAGAEARSPGVSTPRPGLPATSRSHKVREGESLYSVAQQYYGNGGHVSFLYHANRDRIRSPEHVPIGTVLVVPELPAELASQAGE